MIKLAYCNVDALDLKASYNLLSDKRKNKVDNFRFLRDKKLSCGAYLLLRKLLNEEKIHNPQFKIGKYGKAYISNYDNIYFNLSHSGKIVTCAISDMEVGVDVEYNDPQIDLNIAKHYFFNKEYQDIINSNKSSNTFFDYWVLKESYMKYTGLGFHLKLDSFQIEIKDNIQLKNDKTDLKFNLFDINEYKIGVCSKYCVFECLEYKVEDLY